MRNIDSDSIDLGALSNAVWHQPIPPYCPEHALQAVAIAQRYHEKALLEYFYYDTFTFMSTEGPHLVFNSDGKGIIDCSTFINLVLRGITYENSPYYYSGDYVLRKYCDTCNTEIYNQYLVVTKLPTATQTGSGYKIVFDENDLETHVDIVIPAGTLIGDPVYHDGN